jgi:hypothetical protein
MSVETPRCCQSTTTRCVSGAATRRSSVRVAQRLLALAAGIWWNWEVGAPDKRSLVAYDH